MLLRYVKILLSLSVASWGIIAGSMNLVFYESSIANVAAVLSMEGEESVRAISNPLLVTIGYAFIYVGKFATGALCAWGTCLMWSRRQASASTFQQSKSTTLAGCGIALFMLFFGFIVIAGSLFNTGKPGSGLAFAYHQFVLIFMGGIGIIALFIASPEPNDQK